jgi:hypothetical protein
MKKLMFAGVAVMMMTKTNAYIKIVEDSKGFFGYKWVTEYHEARNHNLNCKDPGFSSCKWTLVPPITDSRPISEDRYHELLNYAEIQIYEKGVVAGLFETRDDIVLTWDHDKAARKTTFYIYDRDEAVALGIIHPVAEAE